MEPTQRRPQPVPAVRRKRSRKNEANQRAESARASAASVVVARSPASADPAAPPTSVAPAMMPDRVDALTEAIGGELGRLRGEMRGRDADLVQALHQVAESYDRVAARLDDERRVQELLAEALVRIDRRLAAMGGTAGSARDELARAQRVIGGSIAPRQDLPRIDR